MAFSLGSLYIELKANTAQFLDGMSKASAYAGKTGREIQIGFGKVGQILAPLGEMGEKVAGILGGIGSTAAQAMGNVGRMGGVLGVMAGGVGGITALGGALFAAAEHAASIGAKIFEASQKTGIAARQMSGLMAITKETGGDFNALTASLARAGANLEKAILDPAGRASATFAQLMGSAKNLADLGLKPMGERIQLVLSRIFGLNDVGQRNLTLQAMLGRGWMQNVEALHLLATQGYEPAIAKAREFGIYFDDNSARKAKEFKVQINELKGELAALGITIGERVMPFFREMMQGAVSSGAAFYLLAAVIDTIKGNAGAAGAEFAKYEEIMKNADQEQTDYLVHLQNLTAGEKAVSEEAPKLTTATREHTRAIHEKKDALIQLIDQEQEEINALGIAEGPYRHLQEEYQKTIDKIDDLARRGESASRVLVANAMALEIFLKGVARTNDQLEGQKPPTFHVPAGLPSGLQPMPVPMPPPPGEWHEFQREFKAIAEDLKAEGRDLGENLAIDFGRGIHGMTDALAEFEVTGKSHFGDLLRGIQMELTRTVIQKGVSMALGGLHIPGMGPKRDGSSAGMAIYVRPVDEAGHTIGGPAGSSTAATGAGESDVTGGLMAKLQSIFNSLGSGLSSIFSNIENLLSEITGQGGQGMGGLFSSLFGGGAALGADVSPGKAYLVGETGPELFMPSAAGTVMSNSDSVAALGKGGNTVNIDARGADAGVYYHVIRAMEAMRHQAPAQALISAYDYRMRGGVL